MENSKTTYDPELVLQIYIYDRVDTALMNEVIDSRAFAKFYGVDSSDRIPNGDTIVRLRNNLNANGLQDAIDSVKKGPKKEKQEALQWSRSMCAAPQSSCQSVG